MSGNVHVRLHEKGGGQKWPCCTSLSSSIGSALFSLGRVCQYDLNEVRGFAFDIRWASPIIYYIFTFTYYQQYVSVYVILCIELSRRVFVNTIQFCIIWLLSSYPFGENGHLPLIYKLYNKMLIF